MSTYLLLRDNRESGPHSLEELKALSLRNLDLIWVEGQSEHWDYATEFPELKPFIVPSPSNFRRTVSHIPAPKSAIGVHEPTLATIAANREPAAFAMRTVEEATSATERSGNAQNFHSPQSRKQSDGLWIFSLLLMLMFSAFVVKKLVDDKAQQAIVSSAFIALSNKQLQADNELNPFTFQYAITKENVPVLKKKAALEAIKAKVRLAYNDHKVKLPGGVNDSQLNITNGSIETLQEVGIEIKFLKRNGKVIRTENYRVYKIEPHATKTLVVPPANRGVKVAYKVTDISLKTEKLPVSKA